MKADSEVQQDVLAELEWEPSVKAAQIGVEVNGGIVTLAGRVASFAEKWEAERAAQRVAGVKAVTVEIDVKLPGESERTDADIARSAENAMDWMTYLPEGTIKVLVEHGWVTLSGKVDWAFQRQGAVSAVRSLIGVKGVNDQITLRPSVSSGDIKAELETALKRRAQADAQKILIDVTGNSVTLTGTVHSWSERLLARDTAWGTRGVQGVIDHLAVVG